MRKPKTKPLVELKALVRPVKVRYVKPSKND